MTGDFDSTQVIDELLPALHAGSRADLTFWTEVNLIEWMDEALKRLARTTAVFVERSTAITTANTVGSYSLPARHISTMHVTRVTSALRPASTLELESRDPAYRTTPGTPVSWYEDLQGDNAIALAPVPVASEALPLVMNAWPVALDTGKSNTLVTAPVPLMGYLSMSVLRECYGREGEMEAQDIASHCQMRIELYEAMLSQFYGKGK